jgi:small conductance mechanosensitive channel
MANLGQTVQQFVQDYGAHILGAVLILAVGWLLLRILVGPLRRLLERSRFERTAASFLVNSLRAVVLFAIFLGVLNQLGVQTASLLTLLGAVVLAVSLALQGALANFASGLVVLSFRIARVGDLIETGDIKGRVVELLPFHAVVVTADNQRVTVPNTMLTNTAVRNHTSLSTRRVEWSLPLTAKDELTMAKEQLRACLQADARILPDPPAQVYVKEWSEEKRVLAVNAWTATEDYQAVQQDLLEMLGKKLDEVRQPRAL